MSHLLPKIIKYRDKLFRKAGFRYADCEIYRNGKERILVEPNGDVFHHYFMEDSQIKGF